MLRVSMAGGRGAGRWAVRGVLVFIFAFMPAAGVRAQDTLDVVWQAEHVGGVIAFSVDSSMLLAGVNLYSATDGTPIRHFVLTYNGGGVSAVGLSPDGQYAAVGIHAFNQNLNLFRVSDGVLVRGRITAHSNGTTSIAFSADGQYMLSGGRDGTAKLWHVPDMTLMRTFSGALGYQPRVFAVVFSEDGSAVIVGGQAGVQVFNLADGTLVRDLPGAVSTSSLALAPGGQTVAAGSNATDQYGDCTDCTIKTWQPGDGTPEATFGGGTNDGLTSLAFSTDGRVVGAGSGDRTYNGALRLWRVADGVLLKTFFQDPDNVYSYVTSLGWSQNGKFFAYARADGRVVVAINPVPKKGGRR